MNRKILNQALLFENNSPVYSKVKELCEVASHYQEENTLYFLQAKRREKTLIKNEVDFFRFISQTQDINVKSFNDIESLLNARTRSENILYSGSSKSNYVRVFDNVVVVKKKGEMTKIYQKSDLVELSQIQRFVAVENGETFLNIENIADKFEEEYFVYIAGYCNTLTRNFLKSKEVNFFIDYDIESMNIYESFECKSKKLHIPVDIERYFKDERLHNVELYKNQIHRKKTEYSQSVAPIIKLIEKYNTVVEQEIIYEA